MPRSTLCLSLVLGLVVSLAPAGCDKSPPPAASPADASAATDPALAAPVDDGVGEMPEDAPDAAEPDDGDDDPVEAAPVQTELGPAPVPEDPAEGLTEPTSFADVKLEIRTEAGKVYRDPGKVIPWEQETKIPIDFEGETHEFVLAVKQSGKQASIEMSYSRDGTEVLRKYEFETKVKKREVVRIEDGTALAVTVTPKTIKPHPPTHEKVKNPEGNQPLTGVGK